MCVIRFFQNILSKQIKSETKGESSAQLECKQQSYLTVLHKNVFKDIVTRESNNKPALLHF